MLNAIFFLVVVLSSVIPTHSSRSDKFLRRVGIHNSTLLLGPLPELIWPVNSSILNTEKIETRGLEDRLLSKEQAL